MSTDKRILSEFARRAAQSLEAKKIPKKERLYIPSLEQEITIRSLRKAEIMECMDAGGDGSDDSSRSDQYCVYIAVCDPDLRKTAAELQDNGDIDDPLQVTDIFGMSELTDISKEVMRLSGVLDADPVTVVKNEIKN